MKKLVCCILALISGFYLFAQEPLMAGLDAYARSDWSTAILSFRKAVTLPGAGAEPWYWLVMSELSSEDYTTALQDIDRFNASFPSDARVADTQYQKGRIQFILGKYEDSVKTLYEFITSWPNHSMTASAYYWIGENLYAVGRFDEAKNIFAHLGLTLNSTISEGNKKVYSAVYEFENGLQIIPILKVQDNIITDLRIDIHPEPQKAGALREWVYYSPETLIRQYGSPSQVDFFVGRGPNPSYSMSMYFDSMKLLILYVSYDLGPHLRACPISGQMDSVNVWLDQTLYSPPTDWVSLEQATSLTMEEFAKLMTGDQNKACFNLKEEKFP